MSDDEKSEISFFDDDLRELNVKQITADKKFVSTDHVPAHLEISADPDQILIDDLNALDRELAENQSLPILEASNVGAPPDDTDTESDGSATDISSIELPGLEYNVSSNLNKHDLNSGKERN